MPSAHIVGRGPKNPKTGKRTGPYSVVIEMGVEDGKRQQKWHSGYRTKAEAQEARDVMLVEIRRGEYIDPSATTVAEWLDKWLKDWCKHVKPYTRQSYENVIPQIKNEIGDVPLQRLTATRLQEMVNAWSERPLAASTIGKHMTVLNTALNKAVDLEMIRKNPSKPVSLPRQEHSERDVLSLEEAQRMLREAKESRVYIPILLGLTTGMRRGEICGLRWDDVNLEAASLIVRRNAVQVADGGVVMDDTKTGKTRNITLPLFVVAELRGHAKRQKEQRLGMGNRWQDSNQVCTEDDGTPLHPGKLTTAFRRWAADRGFKVTFHGLRHTQATLLMAMGENAKVTQERLGHSRIGQTLDTYSHLSTEMQRGAAERLEVLNG